ncbi:nucleotidyltransferase family protein [Thalassococcus lentus]|uniref:Nucleotidyltransferase family protein n=1 Tax=Thalassococcus lentus TaxID=1210524 RepID=A0ABT4XND0_9RHOB|nr:nucleotidyltransferase family protein [Thalassococcus lentus]MDA7423456.1 nucleotidyltransferase family protein [Thalassococcus lentus]
MPDAVMLFAAGFGTRMGDLTKRRPKPLVPVAGKTLLDHALELTEGIPNRVVNAHYYADQIVDHLAGSGIAVSVEEPNILDTGGGLRKALPLLNTSPVYTLNTDAVWSGDAPLGLLRDAWRPDAMDALLLCVPVERAIGRKGGGDFSLTPEGRLTRKGDLVYTGAQIIKTDLLHEVKEEAFSLNVLWNRMAESGRLHGLQYAGNWCDVGHPEGISLAEEMLANDV